MISRRRMRRGGAGAGGGSLSSLLLVLLLLITSSCSTRAQETTTTATTATSTVVNDNNDSEEVVDLDAQVVSNSSNEPPVSTTATSSSSSKKEDIPAVAPHSEEPTNEILDQTAKHTEEQQQQQQPPVEESTTTLEQDSADVSSTTTTTTTTEQTEQPDKQQQQQPDTVNESNSTAAVQSGPFIDIFGNQLLSLQMIDETHARLEAHRTNDALAGKKVIGLYFSADWCGPCRKFTPELVSFYKKMNDRRGKKNQFEIVWISRCRDTNAYGQYFTQMGGWYALPPEEAMGQRGMMLGEKYKVKSIPTLVLLDEYANVITLDGRNKIPQDKAGIGFPWRNPVATVYMTVLPRSLRLMIRSQLLSVRNQIIDRIKLLLGLKKHVPPSIAK